MKHIRTMYFAIISELCDPPGYDSCCHSNLGELLVELSQKLQNGYITEEIELLKVTWSSMNNEFDLVEEIDFDLHERYVFTLADGTEYSNQRKG